MRLTVANQLTLLRILLIPPFAVLTLYGYIGAALVVFAVAGLTDLLDGFTARLTKERSSLGAWLDPMADKLLLLTALILLTLPGTKVVNHMPLWLTVLIISRDVVIVGVVAVVNLAIGPRTFHPSIWGKLATGTYIGTGVAFMVFNYLERTSAIIDLGIWLSLALTAISSADYFLRARRIINEGH
ncbi:MAG: CDP-alcohol phosphatidyltransferase family protein [Vicinamibacterales bacterium]